MSRADTRPAGCGPTRPRVAAAPRRRGRCGGLLRSELLTAVPPLAHPGAARGARRGAGARRGRRADRDRRGGRRRRGRPGVPRRSHQQRPVPRSSPRSPSRSRSSCRWPSAWSPGDTVAGEASAGHPALPAGRPGGPHPAAAGEVRVRAGASAWPPPWCRALGAGVGAAALPGRRRHPALRDPDRRSAKGCCGPLLSRCVVAASLLGLAALGLFVSTLTDSGVAAMAATVGLLITVQILDTHPAAARDPPVPLPALLADLRRPAARPGLLGRDGEEPRAAGAVRGGVRLGGLGALHHEGHHRLRGLHGPSVPSAGRAVPRSARRGTNGTNGVLHRTFTTRYVPFPAWLLFDFWRRPVNKRWV